MKRGPFFLDPYLLTQNGRRSKDILRNTETTRAGILTTSSENRRSTTTTFLSVEGKGAVDPHRVERKKVIAGHLIQRKSSFRRGSRGEGKNHLTRSSVIS